MRSVLKAKFKSATVTVTTNTAGNVAVYSGTDRIPVSAKVASGDGDYIALVLKASSGSLWLKLLDWSLNFTSVANKTVHVTYWYI